MSNTEKKEKIMGKFRGEYTSDWPEQAIAIKAAAGWRCVRCGRPHSSEKGHVLTIHHLDNDKGNNAWYNCVPLCQRCHLQIQGKVTMDRPWLYEHSEWFKPYVGGF